MSGARASYFTRWPDETDGPLYVGLHWNERAGQTVLVGVEVWTEAPGGARQSLGPEAELVEDLLPWPPVSLEPGDLASLRLSDLADRFVAAVHQNPGQAALVGPVTAPRGGGRPPTYPESHWAAVAAVYRAARAEGRPTSRAIAERFTVSAGTARRWTFEARRRRFL